MPHEQLVPGRLRNDKCADLRQHWLATGQRRCSGAAGFLACGDDQDQSGRSRQPVGQSDGGGNECCNAAFHIRRAASVELALHDLGSEGVNGPGLRAERDGIEMAGKSERQFCGRPAKARAQLRPPISERNEINGEAGAIEQ